MVRTGRSALMMSWWVKTHRTVWVVLSVAYIGVGKDYAPDSLFSSLVDDIHAYNRAAKPWKPNTPTGQDRER